ncbi:MAG: hypothetical protein J6C30_07400 [Lentisphaeria bacterium]|nr:hypothetical protein [Lentisphaeria bacterium]
MLKKRYLTGKVLAGVALGMCCAGLSAQQFDRDIQLAKELNDINLQDYAQNLIDGLLAENKDNLELRAQRAENFVVQGKMDEAMEIINSLPKTSPAYFDAQAGIGIFYVRQRKFAEGLPMLVAVKEYAMQNSLLNKYKMALAWLLTAYQDQGRAAEAQELLAILANLEEGNSERSEREMKLAQARYGLSCIENMKATFDERLKALKDEYNAKWKAAATDAAKKKTLDGLENQRKNHWNNYSKAIMGGNAAAAKVHGTNYYNVYKNIAKIIGMKEEAAEELGSLEKVKALQPARMKLILKGRTRLTPQEINILAIRDNNDWQDVVYKALTDMEEVQWGGLDACFFMAVANITQAYYHLGEHEKALKIYNKNKDLFKQCDAEYKKNKEPIENSPTADARMWEGYNCLALAKQLEKKDKKQALKYYKRAFVAFGQLLMNYPRHRDGAKNFPVLLELVEKLKALDPRMANALDTQLARVPKPERKASSDAEVEIEDLVPPLPAQQFKDGSTLASDNMKKDRTPNKSTDADWAKCREYFTVVDNELTPIMQGKRLSNGLPKVLNHLLIANGYLGNIFKFRTLVQLSEFMHRDNDLIHHGIAVGANALWMYAERYEAAGAHDVARRLQDETMKIYDTFLRLAPSHPYAPNVAIRLASVEFIRANEIGLKINEKQNAGAQPEEIEKLKKEWIAGFDRALARFDFIFNNFSNRKEFIDKSYELAIESYRLTNRLVEAADMCDRFCEAGSEDAFKILKAKTDTASNLYRHIQENLRAHAKDLQAELDKIVDPVKPAALSAETLELLKKAAQQPAAVKPAPTAAPAPAGKDAAAVAAAKPKKDPKAEEAARKLAEAQAAKAKYDADLKAYEQAVEDFKPQLEKREKLKTEIAAIQAKIPELSRRAIKAVNELRSWIQPGSPFLNSVKEQIMADVAEKTQTAKTDAQKQEISRQIQLAANNKIATEVYRADTIMPWLCEDADDAETAIKEFLAASAKYGASELAKEANDTTKKYKSFVPGYLMKAGMLYLEEGKDKEAQDVFDQLAREYSDRPEGKDVQYYLAKSLYKSGKLAQSIAKFYEIMSKPELEKTLTVGKYREISSMMLECSDPAQRPNAADISQRATEKLLSLLRKDIKPEDWVAPATAKTFREDPEKLKKFVDNMRNMLNKSKADANIIIANFLQTSDPAKAETYLKEALEAYLFLIPDTMRHKSDNPDYYEILFNRAEIRRRLKDYDSAGKDLIAVSRRANSGSSKGPAVIGFYYKAQDKLGNLYFEQSKGSDQDLIRKAHAAYMIVAALNFAKPSPETAAPKLDSSASAKAKLEAQAIKEGAESLEEAVFMSAKTASLLGDAATARRMAEKYVDYYPDGKFIGEARRLAQ